MKLALLSESSADEAALRILVEGILGRRIEIVDPPALRSRGWPSVRDVIPTIIRHVHYRTRASGLVVVVDSNGAPIHDPSHDQMSESRCRTCSLEGIAGKTCDGLSEVSGRARLRVAIGVAVPAIEAWLLSNADGDVGETGWSRAMREGNCDYTKNDLKQRLYGTQRPSLELETERMTVAAREIVASENGMAHLARAFPQGFGRLEEQVKNL